MSLQNKIVLSVWNAEQTCMHSYRIDADDYTTTTTVC